MNDKEMIIKAIDSMVDTLNECVNGLENDKDILISLRDTVKQVENHVYTVTNCELYITNNLIHRLVFSYLNKNFGYEDKVMDFIRWYYLEDTKETRMINQIESIIDKLSYVYSDIDTLIVDMKCVVSDLENLKCDIMK